MTGVVGIAAGEDPKQDPPATTDRDDPTGLFRNAEYPDPAMPTPLFGYGHFPVEGYVPAVGDEVVLCSGINSVPLTKDASDLIRLISLASKGEGGSIRKMVLADAVNAATDGTKVRVLLRGEYSYRDLDFHACRVLMLDGPFRGQTAYTLSDYVVRLERRKMTEMEKFVREMAEKEATRARQGAEKRADTLFRAAQNLEKAGKTKAAIENYREVVKIAATTPLARAAAVRIAALEPRPAPKKE